MARDGTPLPAALSGVEVERVIKIDSALLYLINGALVSCVEYEPLEQTGALTVETAKNALSAMFQCYWECAPMPIGSVQMWAADTPPDKWLLCDGSMVLKADYPELYDVIGLEWGGSPISADFGLPNFVNRSPMGVGSILPLTGTDGSQTQSLFTSNLPVHNHGINDPGHSHTPSNGGNFLVNGGTGTKVHQPLAGSTGLAIAATNSATTGITTQNAGSGTPHNNLHPVVGVNFIIYAGR